VKKKEKDVRPMEEAEGKSAKGKDAPSGGKTEQGRWTKKARPPRDKKTAATSYLGTSFVTQARMKESLRKKERKKKFFFKLVRKPKRTGLKNRKKGHTEKGGKKRPESGLLQ